MLVEFKKDLIVVKHTVEEGAVPYHCFAVWRIPHQDPEMKELLNTFEGSFIEARKECSHFVRVDSPVLWIEEEDEVYATPS